MALRPIAHELAGATGDASSSGPVGVCVGASTTPPGVRFSPRLVGGGDTSGIELPALSVAWGEADRLWDEATALAWAEADRSDEVGEGVLSGALLEEEQATTTATQKAVSTHFPPRSAHERNDDRAGGTESARKVSVPVHEWRTGPWPGRGGGSDRLTST